MKIRSFVCFLTLLLVCNIASDATRVAAGDEKRVDLMPIPKELSWKDSKFRLGDSFRPTVSGKDPRLDRYVEHFSKRLEGRVVRGLRTKGSGSGDFTIKFTEKPKDYPELGMDESYRLRIDTKGVAIESRTSVGAMRALETLLQLLKSDKDGFYFPGVEITDSPRFPWRGILIDPARRYHSVSVLKKQINAMAAVKMNVLHWHLTEDQGFRAETKKLPKLHTLGSDGLYYTQDEMREVIEYAADRGIRVMPEFDMPGHATSWLVGHPEIGSAPGPYEIERDPGIFDPTLNPIIDETYELLDTFLTEMSGIFPDKYIHIGGDENEGKHWDANQEIQAFMKKNGIKDNHELQTYFNKRVLKILQKNNKTMMGWDEIFQPDLPQEVVIHSWRGQKALGEAARKGFYGVLSNGYYIDLMHPAKKHYLVDPIPADSTLTEAERKKVLGGEATMWGEWVSPETIDSRIWMRTAAIAERFWSPQNVRDVDDMYRRLDILSPQLEELGLRHRTIRRVLARRLVPNQDIKPMLHLLEIIEPVKRYQRYQIRKQTMLDPLTGLIDASGADARESRAFNDAVSRTLKNGAPDQKAIAKLRKHVAGWKKLHKKLVPMFESSGALAEAKDVPPKLQSLSMIAEEVLNAHEDRSKKPDIEKLKKEIKEHKTSKAAVEFPIADGILALLEGLADEKAE